MDITKLLSILESNSLWFTDITYLDDPLEGFLNRATVEKFRKMPEDTPKEQEEKTKKIIETNLQLLKQARNMLNVSSWHMNEGESAAMWQLYLKSHEGIAIQSTYERLKGSFKNAKEDVLIGVVKYIDEDTDTIDWTNVINYALHKRKSFEHERELRAIVLSPSDNGGGSVNVDLEILIERIYVAPNSSKWVHELMQEVIKRYGLDKIPVEQSKLYASPLY
ncbi:hypothetical protein JW758_02265 [Candidatus Peregrinibacteria bacterium]|nr:hypothetical protein [Candidatus Peregrinibacteria bacterium]